MHFINGIVAAVATAVSYFRIVRWVIFCCYTCQLTTLHITTVTTPISGDSKYTDSGRIFCTVLKPSERRQKVLFPDNEDTRGVTVGKTIQEPMKIRDCDADWRKNWGMHPHSIANSGHSSQWPAEYRDNRIPFTFVGSFRNHNGGFRITLFYLF